MRRPEPAPQTWSYWPSWPLPFELELERTPGSPCPYLPGETSRMRGFVCQELPGSAYQALLDAGLRRSGNVYYQPACDGCRSCVPLRIPVAGFRPSRSQRRSEKRNADLRVSVGRPAPSEEKHRLYTRYLERRHPEGQMSADRESFLEFLYAPATDSLELTYHAGERLAAVSLCDVTPTSLSAVYSYRDPEEVGRGLGTFCVLTEIDLARRSGLHYHYLGYWIARCGKMAYKSRFRPCEVLGTDGIWRRLEA